MKLYHPFEVIDYGEQLNSPRPPNENEELVGIILHNTMFDEYYSILAVSTPYKENLPRFTHMRNIIPAGGKAQHYSHTGDMIFYYMIEKGSLTPVNRGINLHMPGKSEMLEQKLAAKRKN